MEIDWTDRFWSKVQRVTWSECWIWMGSQNNHGYGYVSQREPRRNFLAHRCAYERVVGQIPAGMVVRHKCDTPLCVNPAHLEPGTQAQNQRDMVERGRSRRGERHHMARLTPVQVAEMRAAYSAGGRTQQSLADEDGVCLTQAHRIVRGKRWTHLTGAAT